MKYLLLSLILAVGLVGCKEKKKEWWSHEKGFDKNCSICKKKLDSINVYGAGYLSVDDSGMVIFDTTADSHTFSDDIGLRREQLSGDKWQIGYSKDEAEYKKSAVGKNDGFTNGQIILPEKPITISPYEGSPPSNIPDGLYIDTVPSSILSDISVDYFSIVDSMETVAIRDNKTRKWEIINCERALEVIYMLDSIRNTDYNVEYKLKNKKTKQ